MAKKGQKFKSYSEETKAEVLRKKSRDGEKHRKGNAPLAQLVEQLTLNQWVPGSNP